MAEAFPQVDLLTQQPDKLPPILGDAANFPVNSPRQWIAPTELQWQRLAKWAAGDFDSDGITEPPVASKLQNLPIGEQPGGAGSCRTGWLPW